MILGWAIVFVFNAAIIVYGFFLARKTESSNDWFLAGRSLPWWGLGLSMFATSLDNGDVISLSGKVYNNGIHIITVFTLATVVGACLCASVRHTGRRCTGDVAHVGGYDRRTLRVHGNSSGVADGCQERRLQAAAEPCHVV